MRGRERAAPIAGGEPIGLAASAAPIAVSVILPTYNEAGNIRAVIAAAQRALRELPRHEIVVVDDDSPDRTWRIVDLIRQRDDRIRCLRRLDRRGLASAIVDGLRSARGEIRVVMDADLQHDPATINELVSALGDADIAVASRYVEGGSTGDWGRLRRLSSQLATRLGRSVLGVSVSDPMSGFFAIRRETFRAIEPKLKPRGFKALLEILYRAPKARTVEVPFVFGMREAGRSKLGGGVIFDYLGSLLLLKTEGRLPTRFLRYAVVGASGVFVQLSTLAALISIGLTDAPAVALAILTAVLSNFIWNNVWTFRDRRLRGRRIGSGFARFGLVSLVGGGLNHAVTLGAHQLTGVHLLLTSLLGIAVATLWNFQANRRWTWTLSDRAEVLS